MDGEHEDLGGDMFYFFQAEDGIRDIGVTGVQTCALPILVAPSFVGDEVEEIPLRHECEVGEPRLETSEVGERGAPPRGPEPEPRCARVRQTDQSFGEAKLRSEEHTSELQSRQYLVCRLLLEKNHLLP